MVFKSKKKRSENFLRLLIWLIAYGLFFLILYIVCIRFPEYSFLLINPQRRHVRTCVLAPHVDIEPMNLNDPNNILNLIPTHVSGPFYYTMNLNRQRMNMYGSAPAHRGWDCSASSVPWYCRNRPPQVYSFYFMSLSVLNTHCLVSSAEIQAIFAPSFCQKEVDNKVFNIAWAEAP